MSSYVYANAFTVTDNPATKDQDMTGYAIRNCAEVETIGLSTGLLSCNDITIGSENQVTLTALGLSGDQAYNFPAEPGTSGQFLALTGGSGQLAWVSGSPSAGVESVNTLIGAVGIISSTMTVADSGNNITIELNGDYATVEQLGAVEIMVSNVEIVAYAAQGTAEQALLDASGAQATANQAILDASGALEVANTAQSTADIAIGDSATAFTNANLAILDASNAVATANQAMIDASGAKATADQAILDASGAQATADQAILDASGAQATATSAAEEATLAKGSAAQAILDASDAQTTADQAILDASGAKATADQAILDASGAKATADQAILDASGAKATADQAILDASGAQATANQAILDASGAQATANEAILRLPIGDYTQDGSGITLSGEFADIASLILVTDISYTPIMVWGVLTALDDAGAGDSVVEIRIAVYGTTTQFSPAVINSIANAHYQSMSCIYSGLGPLEPGNCTVSIQARVTTGAVTTVSAEVMAVGNSRTV